MIESRLSRLEREQAQTRRESLGGLPRLANPNYPAPIRLARVTSITEADDTTDSVTHPLVYVYGINFIDGFFTGQAATVQTIDDDVRDTTEYFAASFYGGWCFDDAIVMVAFYNGVWWIVGPPGILLGKVASPGINKNITGVVKVYDGTTKSSESDTTFTVKAFNRFGDVSPDKWVYLVWVNQNWEILMAEC